MWGGGGRKKELKLDGKGKQNMSNYSAHYYTISGKKRTTNHMVYFLRNANSLIWLIIKLKNWNQVQSVLILKKN